MTQEKFPKSQLPIRKTAELLPRLFQTNANNKFLSGTVDPLTQPGSLEKTVGYIGRRFGKTFRSSDIYLDTDQTLRSRYQLEPAVVVKNDNEVESFYDYIDFKNQLKFFNNNIERDDLITDQEHYSWNPPIDWDKFVNYREYYWVPEGPPPVSIFGKPQAVISTYSVISGAVDSWVFTPDGLTNNPTLRLYRGQTYKFKVNAPGDGFYIRKSLDTGSSIYNPSLPYSKNQIVVYDAKIYRATENISTQSNPIPVNQDARWELVDQVTQNSFIDYNSGILNNGTENGIVTFTVPFDSPDVLFYQSFTNVDKYGKFIIDSIESNTLIDVEKEIIGKVNYVSNSGLEFTNGLVVRFDGSVIPEQYNSGTWVIEGVGEAITLTQFQNLIVSPLLTKNAPDVLFDDTGFDAKPFDDASAYPDSVDYITINKSNIDANPWSRYNRWFHRSILELSNRMNNSDFEALETSRAKRPIIEFKSNLQLINHGSVAKAIVDYIDTFTSDIFSTIEGSQGYSVDGESLFEGARVLIIADTDSLVNNKIYRVSFIVHNGRRQISLIETEDAESLNGEGVLVRRGNVNQGLMYHFNGNSWILSQQKEKVNQYPLFDLFDENGVSFGDETQYPVTSFIGTEIVKYKKGTGRVDSELGFPVSYLNIDNVGDIEFEFTLDSNLFRYQQGQEEFTRKLSTGFYKFNPTDRFDNSWIRINNKFLQPIIDSVTIIEETNTIQSFAVDWRTVNNDEINKLLFYKNGNLISSAYTRNVNFFTFEERFAVGDVISLKLFSNLEPLQGYYEIPIGLERNPLNTEITSFTLGHASDHVLSALEITDEFQGRFPGSNNLRDLNGYQPLSRRFLKHAGLSPVSMLLLCDRDINIVKSIQYVKTSYTEFKNNFLRLSATLDYNQNPLEFVDVVIEEMTRSKNQDSSFFASDMIGTGAFSDLNYTVEDEGIKTFALSQKFDLDTLSNKAIYVYLNNAQLLFEKDYTFNSTFGFVILNVELIEGDTIKIREYLSSANSFIPPTPTKLGLYKKYTPRKYLDDSYLTPREVIQGHDGSITIAYGDYRDDVLLELEYRIYNNLKQQYDSNFFDIDSTLGGYYGSAEYTKQQLDSILLSDFLRWSSNINVDYIENTIFDSETPFTYTYSNMTDPTGTQNLPGFWRGVYQWFYDTTTPHLTPWEMLGFSQQPEWWENEYGPAPYTSNNLILWEDLRDGIIRQGKKAGTYLRYKRASLMSHIPVDGDGKLLNPLISGLAKNFVLVNNQGNFKFGDMSPVEYTWRNSSEYPYSIISALCVLKPFDYISKHFNKSMLKLNKVQQVVLEKTKTFLKKEDIISLKEEFVSGLYVFVNDYVKNRNNTQGDTLNKILGLDVVLSNRISGFVDQKQQKYLLDSKNPKSSSSNIFIPPENYDIIFDVSSPISSIAYSGVVIEKSNRGWKILGYDNLNPFFNFYQAVSSQNDSILSVGGVSETFLVWEAEKFYGNGTLVRFDNKFFRSIRSHTSSFQFDSTLWKQIPKVPVVNAITALKRKNFNRLRTQILPYGTVLGSIQEVVDFLLGYEEYQKSLGIVFDGYNAETQTAYDWTTSAKEFMFWTKHNWAPGSLLSLSPCAANLEIKIGVGVIDNLLDSFYDYQVYKNDGTPLDPRFIDVSRDFQKFTISTTNTNDGIYFLKVYPILKEHVVLFDDRTIFNDVIYDKTTGYRQDRIKVRGFRTVDWTGNYTSPGFVFDNVKISVWEPFRDYRLGDIVTYKSFNWTSRFNHIGTESFNDNNWSKLDLTPEKGLVSNFDYRINQFEDYFDVDSDGLGSSQRDLARHAIGYQQRTYLQDLAEDDTTQFRLYQGFIREKGTANSVVKIFDKLSRVDEDAVVLNEEWAFKIGELGGIDQNLEYEFRLDKDDFKINPQLILITESLPSVNVFDQNLRVAAADFTLAPYPFSKDINLLVNDYLGPTRSAGYVRFDQVEYVLSNREELLDFPIELVLDSDHFWITFDKTSWTVLRYNESPNLRIIGIVSELGQTTLTLNQRHNLNIGEIVGLRQVASLNGFYQIVDITNNSLTFEQEVTDDAIELSDSTFSLIGIFSEVRVKSYNDIDLSTVALLKAGSKLWIDNDGNEKWKVVQKTAQYTLSDLIDYGISNPQNTGKAVLYFDNIKQVITSVPGSGLALAYVNRVSSLDPSATLGLKQIIPPPAAFESAVAGVFGESLAKSPDGRWLAIGSPRASGVKSKFMGDYDHTVTYLEGDIVFYQGKLWEAARNVFGNPSAQLDDSTWIDFTTEDWIPATIVTANPIGLSTGYTEQGMVTLYEYSNQQWSPSISLISPRQSQNEKFGSAISFGVIEKNYYMAVSAIGSLDSTGRVYLFYYNGSNWVNLENVNYAGLYNSSVSYVEGNIVWFENSLYQAVVNTSGVLDPSESTDWQSIDPVSTQSFLPSNIALPNDGSTLDIGIIAVNQEAEVVKEGDGFGFSLAMSRNGSFLAVGAPNSDGQFFTNYRGIWNPVQDYFENDVVKVGKIYYKLVDVLDETSTITSKNENPTMGLPWAVEGNDSGQIATGKVYVYQRDNQNLYKLFQTITTQSLGDINDVVGEIISSGDQFGFDVSIDWSGTTLVVSSPQADINFQNQGSVYVFNYNTDSTVDQFRLVQKLESFERFSNELFGSSVCISPGTEKIVVGAKNTPYKFITGFTDNTTFDFRTTTFSDPRGFVGQVYVFEKKSAGYLLTEKLQADFKNDESFGASVDCTANVVVAGSPTFTSNSNDMVGKVRLFAKAEGASGLSAISQQSPLINLGFFDSIKLYDTENNVKLRDIDVVDGYKLKILGVAEQELSFKTLYDPAIYIRGTEEQVVDSSQAWFEKNVGKLWWDLSTTKFINYEQGDAAYKSGNWNRLAEGSSIDIYEWVESVLLPSEWSLIADTTEGLALGVSGQPKFSDDTVVNEKIKINPANGQESGTLYYFWVKNSTIIPKNNKSRNITALAVSNYIQNPIGSGIPFVAIIDKDKFLAYNFEAAFFSDYLYFNIRYRKNNNTINPIHSEYQLLTEGVADSIPVEKLETKWIDSLLGIDSVGNRVPDISLPQSQRYGLSFRPRQTMFINKFQAMQNVIDNVNEILKTRPFADVIDFTRLNSADPVPSELLNIYDIAIDSYIDINSVGTIRVQQAILRPNIVNGEIDTIDIVNPGFGYRTVPPVVIQGTGKGAEANVTLDNQGRVISVSVVRKGRKYSSATATVRSFTVLVRNDETTNNYWSLYSWDQQRRTFFRSASQSFDVSKYWKYVDWWAPGYSELSKIVVEIEGLYQEPLLDVLEGDLIRIKEYASGGWVVLEKTVAGQGDILEKYTLIGRQNGTIAIDRLNYNLIDPQIGFDSKSSYDTAFYDFQNSKEMRIIFEAVKEDIFVDTLRVEWNKLFFASVKYAFSEQLYIDWAFKTSFLRAIHNVGEFDQRPNYRSDSLDSYRSYLEEVKPYRTTIREYTSRYTRFENTPSAITDFDLPPVYSIEREEILPVNQLNNRFDEYPWKWWTDNLGFSIQEIIISDAGANYLTPPKVLIEGDGVGAEAQAFIVNGKVSFIRILKPGNGYINPPIITLVGGNSSSNDIAKAVAVLGNSLVRTFNTTIKFDRIAKTGIFNEFVQEQSFTASGSTSVFELSYIPTRDKNKIRVRRNDLILLSNEYSTQIYKEQNSSMLRGRLILTSVPQQDDIISVIYEKNDQLLDSINRIEKYYAPLSGMKGKELSQLMTGIDFGGVQIQGTTFDVTGGWDALPWFTDNWDSVESSNDFYYVVDFVADVDSSRIYKPGNIVEYGDLLYVSIKENIDENGVVIIPVESLNWEEYWTIFKIQLPYTPVIDQSITVYLKKADNVESLNIFSRDVTLSKIVDNLQYADIPIQNRSIRIDDPFFDLYDGSTVQPNGRVEPLPNVLMPTFIGDNVTNIIDIQQYLILSKGDTLIFRTLDSDGSVTITDVNLLDTRVSGGSLNTLNNNGAYSTATGLTPEEIVVDGEKFISPDQVPAPEENVPGQVLDSVSIKVYTVDNDGATPIENRVIVSDGITRFYNIGITVIESTAVVVYVDKIKQEFTTTDVGDYTINFLTNQIEFLIAPPVSSVIEIVSIGLGGTKILDYQEFIADGDTSLFLTKAVFQQTGSVLVSVNGNFSNTGFINSSDVIDVKNRTMIQFGSKPLRNSVIKIVCLGIETLNQIDPNSLIRVNEQTLQYDGSTRSFELDNFVNLSTASSQSSILVDLNGTQLTGVDTVYQVYNGTNNNIVLGIDPQEAIGTITSGNIKVYINNVLQRFVTDYIFNGNENLIVIPPTALEIDDIIRVEVDVRAEYLVTENTITIPVGVNLQEDDILTVTWFSNYPSMNIVSDEYSGGKVSYKLARIPLSADYVWIYKNGIRLTKDRDFSVSVQKGSVNLNETSTKDDTIKIVQFAKEIYQSPKAYEIFKDMLNNVHYKRFSKNNNIKLTKNLNYFDTELEVTDASLLGDPIPSRNIPGVIFINNERIEYLKKENNTLSQLRRGSLGTGIAEVHAINSYVIDVGVTETIPYVENQEKIDFISDGSSLIIGPLSYVPRQSIRSNWFRIDIPEEYGPCDDVEVFVAGKRLKKDPAEVYNEILGSASPEADEKRQAEFSTDGQTPFIRLSETVPAGVLISIIRRNGRTWQEKGVNTAITGKSFLQNNTPVINFIAKKGSELPE